MPIAMDVLEDRLEVPGTPPEPQKKQADRPFQQPASPDYDAKMRRLGDRWTRILASPGPHEWASPSECDMATVTALTKRNYTHDEIIATLQASPRYADRIDRKGEKHTRDLFEAEITKASGFVDRFPDDDNRRGSSTVGTAPSISIVALTVPEWLAADDDAADIVIGDGGDGFVLSIDGKLAIAGPTGIGKSNILLRLGRNLTEGVPFLRLPIPRRRRVVHLALEGSRRGLRKRLAKVWDGADEDALSRFHLAYTPLNVMQDGAAIDELLNFHRPEVLIIDPLRNAHTFDENDSQQIAELTNTLDGIISRHGCALAFAHHHRKSQGFVKDEGIDAVRGSTAFTGWLSSVLIVKPRPKEPDMLLADWVKVRDSEVALPPMELEFHRSTIDFKAETRREDVNLEDAIMNTVFQSVVITKKEMVDVVRAGTRIGKRKISDAAVMMVQAGKLEAFIAPEDKRTGAHSYRIPAEQKPLFDDDEEAE